MAEDGFPRHVAIIMDGNGRWAKKRHLPRALGHRQGGEAVRRTVKAAETLELECLTLYAFSSENWKREKDEIADLMNLMRRFIETNLDELIEARVRLAIIGDYRAFAPDIVAMLEDALERTSGGNRILAVALNYGSQQEIARAARAAAAAGEITPQAIERHLDTAALPPLDLVIRTSGEVRLSNFLLWQAAYAEMIFTDVLWPDFDEGHLRAACEEFARRERRYGGR
ncbi:polyprenyl diphosphate synthase [Aurantiacibacter spongiae]|uniref:Isoprenyl transferase n=1 Tax=Aurantiacibacter spongiae TaxID=2488860 RepID=A0A3N5CVU5_9SPHN|nr:polyprenyl diphosphate synthase [Aurantiacibacter spongiae]RPF72476.1 di-trans,poly-cis-decaprenylcistransferase [Aurantiacibacter spongiae]